MNMMDRAQSENGNGDICKVDGNQMDKEEEELRDEIEHEKASYRKHYVSLKNIKGPHSFFLFFHFGCNVLCEWLSGDRSHEMYAEEEPQTNPARLWKVVEE